VGSQSVRHRIFWIPAFAGMTVYIAIYSPNAPVNYPAAELRGIKMNFYLINPDAEHRGILLIKRPCRPIKTPLRNWWIGERWRNHYTG